jgi:hypothetical protein
MILRYCIILLLVFFLPLFSDILLAETNSIQKADTTVFYEKGLASAAGEVAEVYSSVRHDLQKTFGWEIDFRPDIVLAGDRDTFRKIVGVDSIIAFAVPGRNLIVLDMSRVYTKPFTLKSTLKHEVCHLVLHRYIGSERLPRWLDEGVCQWVSGGLGELDTEGGRRYLPGAAVSGSLFSLGEMARFPYEEKSIALAYEQSRSIVEYTVKEFGEEGLLRILEGLKEGESLDRAIRNSTSMSLYELEEKWHAHLKRKYTWFYYLSSNLYTILFVFAAAITVYGFIRLMKKKREYVDEDEEGDTTESKKPGE